MTYSLDQFCDDTRRMLQQKPGPEGRDDVRANLTNLLTDDAFLSEYCGPNAEPGITTVHRCAETGFNVLVHVYASGKSGPPHDHGASWAIYGQAVGHTDMATWKRLDDGAASGKANLEKERDFRLDPGMAGTFEPKDIHSIQISDNSRFVRVTGTDLNTIETLVFNTKEGAVAPGARL